MGDSAAKTNSADLASLHAKFLARRSKKHEYMMYMRSSILQGWMVFQSLLRPWLQKLLSLSLAATSFMVVWCEATIGTGPQLDLSPFSHVSLSLREPVLPYMHFTTADNSLTFLHNERKRSSQI